jgi:hypothetical protein
MEKVVKEDSNCHVHDLAIQKLESKMEVLERHHNFYKEKFGGIELSLEELKYFSINTNNHLENFKDIPDRLRKQEDKAVIYDLIKVGLGIILGLLITGYINRVFIAPKESHDYSIVKNK